VAGHKALQAKILGGCWNHREKIVNGKDKQKSGLCGVGAGRKNLVSRLEKENFP